jgi:hypothetical protein
MKFAELSPAKKDSDRFGRPKGCSPVELGVSDIGEKTQDLKYNTYHGTEGP